MATFSQFVCVFVRVRVCLCSIGRTTSVAFRLSDHNVWKHLSKQPPAWYGVFQHIDIVAMSDTFSSSRMPNEMHGQ